MCDRVSNNNTKGTVRLLLNLTTRYKFSIHSTSKYRTELIDLLRLSIDYVIVAGLDCTTSRGGSALRRTVWRVVMTYVVYSMYSKNSKCNMHFYLHKMHRTEVMTQ